MYVVLIAFLFGAFYRLAEIESNWMGTWRWKGTEKQPFKLRRWVTDWMKGIIPVQVPGTWQWRFHRMTFSLFEDGNHFFGNSLEITIAMFLPFYFFFEWTFLSITWPVALLLWPARWFGTKIVFWMIIEDT